METNNMGGWTYKKAYDSELKKMQEQTAFEYKELIRKTKLADESLKESKAQAVITYDKIAAMKEDEP